MKISFLRCIHKTKLLCQMLSGLEYYLNLGDALANFTAGQMLLHSLQIWHMEKSCQEWHAATSRKHMQSPRIQVKWLLHLNPCNAIKAMSFSDRSCLLIRRGFHIALQEWRVNFGVLYWPGFFIAREHHKIAEFLP